MDRKILTRWTNKLNSDIDEDDTDITDKTLIDTIMTKYDCILKWRRKITSNDVGKYMIKLSTSITSKNIFDKSFIFDYKSMTIYELIEFNESHAEIQCIYTKKTRECDKYHMTGWIILNELPQDISDYILLKSKNIIYPNTMTQEELVKYSILDLEYKQYQIKYRDIINKELIVTHSNHDRNDKYKLLSKYSKSPDSWSKADEGKYFINLFESHTVIYKLIKYGSYLTMTLKSDNNIEQEFNVYNWIDLKDCKVRFCFNCLNFQSKHNQKTKYVKCGNNNCLYVYYCTHECKNKDLETHKPYCGK